MPQPVVKTYLLSDTAFTLSFELPIGQEAHQWVIQAAQAIKNFLGNDYRDLVPSYTSLTIFFNDAAKLEANLRPIEKLITALLRSTTSNNDEANPDKQSGPAVKDIPVCYDLSLATDLPLVMEHLQLSQQEIVQRHTNLLYKVYMIGFVPGFAYMGTLDPTLYMPRKQTPSRSVPAGSVAIAAHQTGIYPFDVPGGWHVIGRTPLRMFNKNRDPVCLLQPGQCVRFFSISIDEFNSAS
ncbi:MAG: 5-oxoprolinase subunit PxpB [Sphingomonadales bacterium]